MIFSEQYQKAIFEAVTNNRWDIYNAEHPKFIVPGSLEKCLITTPELELKTPYILLPGRELFTKRDQLNLRLLDEKILNMAEKVKPLIPFYLDIEVLEGFVLSEIEVKLDLVYHPRYKMDPRPRDKHPELVSYRHFVDMLQKLNQPRL